MVLLLDLSHMGRVEGLEQGGLRLLQTVTKVFDARRIFFAYFLGNVNGRKILPSAV